MDLLARLMPTVRIYCKAGHNFSLAIRGGKVVLALANPADEYQHWYVDESQWYVSTPQLDGMSPIGSGFALVNKKTGEVIKRASSNQGPALQLIPYNGKQYGDKSALWTKSHLAGDYHAIEGDETAGPRVLNAFGDYAHDGTNITVCSWANGKDNEMWKIEPYATFKIYCKAGPDFNITIRDGKLVLAKSNPSDELQHWYKDDMYNFRRDDEGNPSFVLINKVTGQAMKHSVGSHQPVQLVHYSPVAVDESILWTESKDFGDGYKTIRKFTDSSLIVNASGDITIDGASIILQPCANGADNQQWKMESVRKPFVPTETTVKLYCKAGPNLSVTIRDSKVVLAPSNPTDEFQHWYKYDRSINKYNEDDEGSPFALVNKKTGQAIRHAVESHKPVQLIPYNPNVLNEFVLWTQGKDLGDGYKPIREANNTHLNFNACGGYVDDGTSIIVFPWANCAANEVWRIEPYTTVKVYCKAEAFCNITVVNGKVGYVESNPSDKFQHWYRDERYRTTKDAEGYPAFALINKATGDALKHSTRSNEPLQLVCYKPTAVDESILWTEGKDLRNGYKAIRMAHNIHLNIRLNQELLSNSDTFMSTDPNNPVILSTWNNGADNEMWKMKTHSDYEIPEISCSLL